MKALSHTPMWKKILGSFMVAMTIAVMVYVCGSLVATASEEDATLQEIAATQVDATAFDEADLATTPDTPAEDIEAVEEEASSDESVADPTEGTPETTPETPSDPTISDIDMFDEDGNVYPLEVSITNAPAVMDYGTTAQLGLRVVRGDTPVPYTVLKWSSEDPGSLKVSETGLLTARNISEEPVIITAKVQSDDEYYDVAEAEIQVSVIIQQLTAEFTNGITSVGQCTSTQMGVQAYRGGQPVSLLDYRITNWDVSNQDYLQIDRNGVLSAIAPTDEPVAVTANVQSTVAPHDEATATCYLTVTELVATISGPDVVTVFSPTDYYLAFNGSVTPLIQTSWNTDGYNVEFAIDPANPFMTVCTPKDSGTFDIACTITFPNGTYVEASKEITVDPLVLSIKAPSVVEANVPTILAINCPAGITEDSFRKVYWDVADYQIARVTSDGTFMGLNKGTTTIQAQVIDANGTTHDLTADIEVIHQITSTAQPVNIFVSSNLPGINGRYMLATIYVSNLPVLGSHYAKGIYNEYLDMVLSGVNPANPIPLNTLQGLANFVWSDVTWSGTGDYGEELGLEAIFDDEGNAYWYLNGYLDVEEQDVDASLAYLFVDEYGTQFDGSFLSGAPISSEYTLSTGDSLQISAPEVGTAELAAASVNGIDITQHLIENGRYSVIAVRDSIAATVVYRVNSDDLHSINVAANYYLTDGTGDLATASYYDTEIISRTNWIGNRLSVLLQEADEMRQFDCNANILTYSDQPLFTLEGDVPTEDDYQIDIYLQPNEFDYEVQVYVNDVPTLISPALFAPELDTLNGKALWGSYVSVDAVDQILLNDQEWNLEGVTPAKIGNPDQVGANIVRVDYSRYIEPAPVDPNVPVIPGPSGPVVPVDPNDPQGPSGPVTPVDPTGPTVPGDPTDPDVGGPGSDIGSDIPFIPVIGEYVGAYMPGAALGAGTAQAIATFVADTLGEDAPEAISEIADSLVPLSSKIQTDDELTPVYYSIGINLWLSILWGVILASILVATIFVVRRYNKYSK